MQLYIAILRKTLLLLGVLFFCGPCFSSMAAEDSGSSAPAKTAIIDRTLARQCLAQAGKGDGVAESFIRMRLAGADRRDIERLAALVRAEVGEKALSHAAAVPPGGDLSIAWLLNRLREESETLAFDLATDGFFVRRIGPGKRYLFRPFGQKEIVVRMNAATLGRQYGEQNMKAASRLYLRTMPDGKEYYAVKWLLLKKQRNAPPAPNPEGRYVQGLMNMNQSPERRAAQ